MFLNSPGGGGGGGGGGSGGGILEGASGIAGDTENDSLYKTVN